MPEEEDWKASRVYGSVLSIGAQCMTGSFLKSTGLKRFSGPFDWIFSNLRMVCDCIDDDFATLLDRQFLEPVPAASRHSPDTCFAEHRHFQRRYGLQTMFNHYDPTEAEGYAYLQRCVDRFRQALNAEEPQLLLAIVERSQGGRFGFDRLCRALEPYPAIDALVLVSPDTRAPRGLELWEERDRHRLVFLHTLSAVAGIHFADEEDNDFLRKTLIDLIRLSDRAATAVASASSSG